VTGVLHRGEIVDVLIRDDECVILTPQRCLRLSQVATTAFQFLHRPRTRQQLVDHLEARFGAAPDDAVDDLVDALVEVGVVVWEE
jgi:hypothetical protein